MAVVPIMEIHLQVPKPLKEDEASRKHSVKDGQTGERKIKRDERLALVFV